MSSSIKRTKSNLVRGIELQLKTSILNKAEDILPFPKNISRFLVAILIQTFLPGDPDMKRLSRTRSQSVGRKIVKKIIR